MQVQYASNDLVRPTTTPTSRRRHGWRYEQPFLMYRVRDTLQDDAGPRAGLRETTAPRGNPRANPERQGKSVGEQRVKKGRNVPEEAPPIQRRSLGLARWVANRRDRS